MLTKKSELIKKLNELAKGYEPSYGHHEADDLLLEWINDPEIEEAYNKIEKWYE